jgi:CxxC motif-containing protein
MVNKEIIDEYELRNIERIFRYLRRNVTVKNIMEVYYSTYKKKMSKASVMECMKFLERTKVAEKVQSGWNYIKSTYVFSCDVCDHTSLSKQAMFNHMFDKHVKQYTLGQLKNCKIAVKEVK